MSMLRSIREKKGLTLGQLAARASIPARTLTEYEEGRQPIPLPHAKLLAKALWVQIEDLMPPAGATAAAVRPSPPLAPAPMPTHQPPVQAAPANPAPQYQQRPPANGTQAAPQYAPRPTDQAGPRTYRDQQGQGYPAQRQGGAASAPAGKRGAPDGRPARPPRPAPSPPKPISEGQVEELVRLGARLGFEQEKLELQLGKPVSALTRTDAKEWIKKLREMAAENSPGGKVHYGHWPGSREDEEAAYLGRQREAGNVLRFKLFDGEELTGTVTEFTPYTITVRTLPGGEETVLRKLAIVYYRQTGEAAAAVPQQSAGQVPHSHQPEETGVDSDRAGEPSAPEGDNMDEDRGV